MGCLLSFLSLSLSHLSLRPLFWRMPPRPDRSSFSHQHRRSVVRYTSDRCGANDDRQSTAIGGHRRPPTAIRPTVSAGADALATDANETDSDPHLKTKIGENKWTTRPASSMHILLCAVSALLIAGTPAFAWEWRGRINLPATPPYKWPQTHTHTQLSG